MKLFSGFPDGKLSVTPLPNLFFSELLPAIDNLEELKVTLHIYWKIKNRKAREPLCVTLDELLGDKTLIQSIGKSKLQGTLDAAVSRGTLLHRESNNDWYFINDESGRRAFEKTESLEKPARKRESAQTTERPNIFALYEQNIGMLTPMIAEELKEAEKEYSAEWIEEAFRIAVKRNKRSWDYIEGILKRMKTEGRGNKSEKSKNWWGDEYDKFVKR